MKPAKRILEMMSYRAEAISGGNPDEGIVCTLFEGDYHLGLAALLNSLVQNGFQGCIAAGYRGSLPPWIGQLKPLNGTATSAAPGGSYEIAPGVRIDFIYLDTPVHFANYKPQFMKQVIGEGRGARYIWYFDPDIVIRCAWSFYMDWTRHGVALCEDVNFAMPANHPIRFRWMELASSLGLKNPLPLSRYYNSGFVGLPTAHSGFLDRWQATSRLAESQGFDTRAFPTGDRTKAFFMVDQDALNIAAMYTEYPLTTLGAEGMGFVPGGGAMFHAVGAPKPWRKKMVLSALGGVPPSEADKGFLASLNHPIRPYSDWRMAERRLGCRVGALIGRFYRRG
jgi:hypothetical protein